MPALSRPAESVVRRHAVWACVALAYVLVFPYFPRLNNPNENVRVWSTRALVEHGTFALDAVEREWGEVSDRAVAGGKRISGKAPGTSLLGVPVLFAQTGLWKLVGAGAPSQRATTWTLRVFTVALPLVIFLFFFARQVERVTASPAARDLLVVGLGLGTMMYPYGLLFVGHAQAAALLFAGFLCLAAGPPTTGRLVLAGALVSLSVVFEYPVLFAALAVTGYAAFTLRRRVVPFLAGGLGPAVLLGAYHTVLFGRPWETPLGHVDDPIFREFHRQGVLGFVAPRPEVFLKSLVSVDYGLFVWSPLLLAGLVAAAVGLRARDRRAERVVIVAVFALMLLFLSGMANWRGGWCAGGPRYIAAVVPFLTWGLALSWRSFWQPRPWAVAGLGGLVGPSVFACGLGGAFYPHYPLALDNPLFDLTLPFLGAGYAPRGLGTLLGLRGWAALLPWAAAVVAAVAVALAPLGRRAGLSVALMAAFVAGLGLANPSDFSQAAERSALRVVRDAWEPPPR
jgi:hypothetical protein